MSKLNWSKKYIILMRIYVLVFLFCFSAIGYSQETEEDVVKKAVNDFFVGFHQKDSVKMQHSVAKDVIMQTITKDKQGRTYVKTEMYDDFVNSIISIPQDAVFEEKLGELNIQIDGEMSHVWSPYEFWYNGTFSHCGVNSIQMVKLDGIWKIVYLIDTRRKENCIK